MSNKTIENSNRQKTNSLPRRPATPERQRGEQAGELRTPNSGFTLIELLVTIAIVVSLTTVVLVNFRHLRYDQQLRAASRDTVSRLKEVQTGVLAGRIVTGGVVPTKYDMYFTDNGTTFRIDYVSRTTSTTTLETVTLPENIRIDQITVSGVPAGSVLVTIESPFGHILINGRDDLQGKILFTHDKNGGQYGLLVDAVSGRIALED